MRFEFIDNNIGLLRRDNSNAVRRNRPRGNNDEAADHSDEVSGNYVSGKYHVKPSKKIDNNIFVRRNRPRGDNDEVADYSDENSNKFHGVKRGKKYARSVSGGKLFLFAVILSFSMAIYVGMVKRRHNSTFDAAPNTGDASSLRKSPDNGKTASIESSIESKPDNADTTSMRGKLNVNKIVPTRDWSHCIKNPPSPKETAPIESKVEPMWLPAYPDSLPLQGYKDFLAALTGVNKAAKSYYRVSPHLKRCHSPFKYKIEAVTCEIVHPIVPCQHPHPSQQAENFSRMILVGMRNPLTAFSAIQQSKAEAYHGQQGQVEKEKWIEFRDEFVGSTNASHMMKEWKNFIMEWRDMKPYIVDAYMPWEYWIDEAKGPAMVRRLSLAFKKQGFPVLYDDKDVECLWHKHIYEPIIVKKNKHLEEGWYEPEYTLNQLEMIAGELEKFATEIKEKLINGDRENAPLMDNHLYAILQGYGRTVRGAIQENKA